MLRKFHNESKLKLYWTLLRPFATPGLLLPMLLGWVYGGCHNIYLFLISFFGSLSILYGTHYHNSLSDYLRGIDKGKSIKSYTKASAILPAGLVTVKEVKIGTLLLYGIGVCIFIYLSLRSLYFLVPLIIGLSCAIAYNEGLKVLGFGDLLLAISFGPASVLAGYIPATLQISIKALLLSLLPAILWCNFFLFDQLSDSEEDKKSGIRSLAVRLSDSPFPPSRIAEFGFFFAILTHISLVVNSIIKPETLIALLATPFSLLAILSADTKPTRTAQLQIYAFGAYITLVIIGLSWGMIS